MKARSLLIWVAVPCLVGVLAFLTRPLVVWRSWQSLMGRTPMLECPTSIDLGEQTAGDILTHNLAISNRGGRTLVIDNIESTCACSGLERVRNGESERVDSLRIEGGQTANVHIRVAVQGMPGSGQDSRISFRTSDPGRQNAWINIRISRIRAVATPVPAAIAFGKLQLHEKARQILKVYRADKTAQTISAVHVVHPDRLSIKLLPLAIEEDGREPQRGTLLGRIEVIPRTDDVGTLENEIQIVLSERSALPCVVQVIGQVVGPVELLPPVLVLPRRSDAGPVFAATSRCRTTNGQPCAVRIASMPDGIQAELKRLPEAGDAEYEVSVTCIPSRQSGDTPIECKRIQLIAEFDAGKSIRLELPVYCQQPQSQRSP